MKITDLSKINEGESAVITGINTTGAMRRRLLDLGLICGTKVECVLKSPSGNPKAFKVRGATIALRAEDSCGITVMADK